MTTDAGSHEGWHQRHLGTACKAKSRWVAARRGRQRGLRSGVFLIVVGLPWLVPTIGLLLVLAAHTPDMAASGWWEVFT